MFDKVDAHLSILSTVVTALCKITNVDFNLIKSDAIHCSCVYWNWTNLPSSCIIRFRFSMHNVFNARFFGGPILCGNNIDVSTTTSCINFNAFRSLSKLWPMSTVFELNIDNSTACTSRNVRVSFRNVSSEIPENLFERKMFFFYLINLNKIPQLLEAHRSKNIYRMF